ncbi:MAG: pantoate--beta-alanine ligase, partial [Bacteroidota bacterium]
LTIVNPHTLCLGEKDYQQCMVISKLLELTNRTAKTELIIGSTMREKDGLAMSSRNARLTDAQRKKAAAIYQCLNELKKNIHNDEITALKEKVILSLEQEGFQVDYVEIADAKTLLPVSDISRSEKLHVLIAAKIGSVRLIDNISLLS